MRILTQKSQAWLANPGQVDDLLKGQEITFQLCDGDMTDVGWILLGDATCMVRIEDEDKLVLATVARLEEAEKKLQADTQVKLMKLQEMKNNLLSLTYTTFTEPPAPVPSNRKSSVIDFDDDIPF